MDPITLTIVGVLVGVVALVPATLGWLEARRQRRLTERALPLPNEQRESSIPDTQSTHWRCGIYDYPPLSSWPAQPGIDPSGPFVLLGKSIAEAVGRTVTFEQFTYDDFYTDTNAIPDMIVGMFETRRRAARVVFSRSFYEIGLQGICRIEQQGDVLHGLREGRLKVAVYSSEVGWEFVQDEFPDAIEQHRVATLVGGHHMHTMALLNERVYDVVIMDHLSCVTFMNEPDHRQQFRLAFEEPPQKYRACIALKKEHSALLPTIDAAIVAFRNTSDFLRVEHEALAGLERVVERRGLRAHSSPQLPNVGLQPIPASETRSRGG